MVVCFSRFEPPHVACVRGTAAEKSGRVSFFLGLVLHIHAVRFTNPYVARSTRGFTSSTWQAKTG